MSYFSSNRVVIAVAGCATALGLAVPTQAADAVLQVGVWGGDHLRLVAGPTDVQIEFDCAAGHIPARPAVAADGAFVATGIYAQERGGPGAPGQPAMPAFPAQFSGRIDGPVMHITITSEAFGRPIGSFRVELGKTPVLEKCM